MAKKKEKINTNECDMEALIKADYEEIEEWIPKEKNAVENAEKRYLKKFNKTNFEFGGLRR